VAQFEHTPPAVSDPCSSCWLTLSMRPVASPIRGYYNMWCANCRHAWRHPQNRIRITYRNAARERPIHGCGSIPLCPECTSRFWGWLSHNGVYTTQCRLHRTRSSHNFPTYLQEDALVFDCVFIGLYSGSNLRTAAVCYLRLPRCFLLQYIGTGCALTSCRIKTYLYASIVNTVLCCTDQT